MEKTIMNIDNKPVWIASYKGKRATVKYGQTNLPGWIHEHGEDVEWKLISGKIPRLVGVTMPDGQVVRLHSDINPISTPEIK